MTKKPKLSGRGSLSNAQVRRKNGNICVATLRNIYGEDFAPGFRGDVTLNSLLKRSGYHSLSEFLEHESNRQTSNPEPSESVSGSSQEYASHP